MRKSNRKPPISIKAYLITVAIVAVIFISLLAAGRNSQPADTSTTDTQTTAAPQTDTSDIPVNGQDGYVKKDIYAAPTQKAYDTAADYAYNKNYDALTRMQSRGEISVLKQGTKITVIDSGLASSQVEVVSSREKVFTTTSNLTKTKP